ncbi:DNA-3-methyladenine glycosylase 2 family protein [Rhizobium daejeonense]|uniref:DNA-3-methyladenine glycosylase II n=1 Tax=Rhizobium daejeonense TaxID=240521 RepID=A0A6M1S371_9HYPH|nr:DNA-3-methyladenine glycosylase [Rhizobium daejeonense]NGO65545.1 DNA-3-methyladenine glycosylase 2 family protein [Rhizobium daejeonense]
MTITTRADLDAGLDELLTIDPRLVPIAGACGPLPLRLSEPGFAGLANIIVSQMVSRASADAIWRRIVAATGEVVTSEAYLALDPAVIATLGLSRAKAETLHAVAGAVASGELDLGKIAALEASNAIAKLTSYRGIGLWTAEVYLMFCGGHPDVFPVGDVALRVAVGDVFGYVERPDFKEVKRVAEVWQPWRSVAARLFWAHYALRTGRQAIPVDVQVLS